MHIDSMVMWNAYDFLSTEESRLELEFPARRKFNIYPLQRSIS